MNGKSRAVIRQDQLATLRNLRVAAKVLTVELRRMEREGCSVEPGELNFMKGKLLLHSPTREPIPQVKIESFDLIWKLLSSDDVQAMRACLIPMDEWRKRREQLLGK